MFLISLKYFYNSFENHFLVLILDFLSLIIVSKLITKYLNREQYSSSLAFFKSFKKWSKLFIPSNSSTILLPLKWFKQSTKVKLNIFLNIFLILSSLSLINDSISFLLCVDG